MCDGSTDFNKEEMCGRPLGLQFNKVTTCDLYIADAYFGLLKVGPKGGVAKQLATTAEGVPFRFANDLDIDTKSLRTGTFGWRWMMAKAVLETLWT